MLTLEQNDLILKYLHFAEKLAKKYSQFRDDELKSAAYVGLIDAAIKYNGKSNFSTYARFRINGAMKDYLRKQLNFIKFRKNLSCEKM